MTEEERHQLLDALVEESREMQKSTDISIGDATRYMRSKFRSKLVSLIKSRANRPDPSLIANIQTFDNQRF